VIAFTVLLSVLAHGLSDGPLAKRYGPSAPVSGLPSPLAYARTSGCSAVIRSSLVVRPNSVSA
jgi:hypothetical protein